ncbi:MAG: NUDIX hydrolase [bacterium]|nr:NUDIX hydrolase [bacterium]
MHRKDQGRLPESVLIFAYSPTRTVLVKDKKFLEPRWKLPGGGVETSDEDRTEAAIRECRQETGITLSREDFLFCTWIQHCDGHYQYIFVAEVTEEQIDSRLKIGDENGRPIQVAAFETAEVPTMLDLLEKHRPLIAEALGTTNAFAVR